jgi:UDP-N-acetylglucosamine 2-epimerase
VVKASVLVEELGERWRLLTVDTGQHYDYALNTLLYEQLGICPADVYLEVGSGDHATQTSEIMTRSAAVFATHRPWALVVIGDTNSTLGCALAAAKMRIPVVHVEAGLRAADALMAEEINRRVVDAISAVLCAPSVRAESRLREEHVTGAVHRTGDIARDVLIRNLGRAPATPQGADWPITPGTPFIFATLHRAELTDDAARLGAAIDALLSAGTPVTLATHPRTRERLERLGLSARLDSTVHVLPPLGYLETLACIRDAWAVVTDSGGVQREAYWLGTPCITMRAETEWHETVGAGANLTFAPERSPREFASVLHEHVERAGHPGAWDRNAYGDGHAALSIRAAIAPLAAERIGA